MTKPEGGAAEASRPAQTEPSTPPADQWPASKIEMRPVDELIPFARNSRTHSEEQVRQIAAAMREWGWTTPVLVDETGTILAGHCRLLAARILGLAEVPVMTARGWSEAKKRAYVIADNKLAENAGWDAEALRVELHDLAQEDYRLELIGFSGPELTLAMFDPDFQPTDLSDQPRLDEKRHVTCPECGHAFPPS